jgi:hypothetical protein
MQGRHGKDCAEIVCPSTLQGSLFERGAVIFEHKNVISEHNDVIFKHYQKLDKFKGAT